MSRPNKISADFTVAQKDAVVKKIDEVVALMPFLISLPEEERKKYGQMGPKSVAYVQQCLEAALQYPKELKANFNTPEFQKDVTLINNLLRVRMSVASLLESIEDSMKAAGIDAMASSGEIYDALKSSSKNNANVKTMVNLIGERFKGQGPQKKEKDSDISQKN